MLINVFVINLFALVILVSLIEFRVGQVVTNNYDKPMEIETLRKCGTIYTVLLVIGML